MRVFRSVLALVMVVALVATASVGFSGARWTSLPIQIGNTSGANHIGLGAASDTVYFSVQNCAAGINYVDAVADSVLLGFLQIFSDTTAGDIAVTAINCSLQVMVPGFQPGSSYARNYSTVKYFVHATGFSLNQRAWAIPVYLTLPVTAGAGGNSGLLLEGQCRALIDADGTGIPAGKARFVSVQDVQ